MHKSSLMHRICFLLVSFDFLFLYFVKNHLGSVAFPHLANGNMAKLFTSLDNTLTFHLCDYRADEWFMYEVGSAAANCGRGYAQGRMFTRDGRLIVSTAQEVLARFTKSTKL